MQTSTKKLLLVSPSYKISNSSKAVLRFDPPVGLLNIASFLADKGYQCDIVNTAFEDIDYERIELGEYGLVGFTVFIGEFLKNARQISAKIRKINPLVAICYGGVMASLFPERMLAEYPVDYVVRYEGEYTLWELLKCREDGKDIGGISGLSYKLNGGIINNPPRLLEHDLNNFPVPKWELFGPKCNINQNPYYFRIMTSKGCPFNCSFCYKHSIDEELRDKTASWRYRGASHVLAEMDRLHELNGTVVFTLGDDNFFVHKMRAIDILSLMKQRGYYIEQCIAHLNNLRDEIIDIMAGIVQTVIYSIESASPRLAKLLNKHINLDVIPEVNRKLFARGISTTHNFMVGLPTETDVDLRKNIEMMMSLKKINPYVRAVTYVFLPLPCTPLWDYVEKEMGYELPKKWGDYEEATFDSSKKSGLKFRPWLTEAEYEFLHRYSVVFEDAFQINNFGLSAESRSYLEADARLKDLFQGVEEVNKPARFYRPYILDRVLKGEQLDLLHDLERNAQG